MKITKIKIRLDNNDGTYTEAEDIIPYEIANEFLCNLITWKDDWLTTVNNHNRFQKSVSDFKLNQEQIKDENNNIKTK